MNKMPASRADLRRPDAFKRKAVKISTDEVIRTGHLPGMEIPLVVEPAVAEIDLVDWAANNRERVEELLLQHRALLFRNFNTKTVPAFERFITATSNGVLMEYRDRSSPRHEVGEKIYTSTDYPPDQSIFLHNEGTYWMTWPLKIYFFCLLASPQGGETPIADTRKIFSRISPEARQGLIDKKIMYQRNFNQGFGLTWQAVFQTTDRAVVEQYCRRNSIEFEWKDGDRLRTYQIRPAVARHPRTGETVWFNHATFFNVSTLEASMRDALLEMFDEADLPFNTYYGDGSAIQPSVLDEFREAYKREKVSFTWQAGDILMLDNMSVAHGRSPYAGERKVLVGMADPFDRVDD
ncbi:MAG: TauD/TfdA family dioxygenase [Pyrinomonadaceae bacterium]